MGSGYDKGNWLHSISLAASTNKRQLAPFHIFSGEYKQGRIGTIPYLWRRAQTRENWFHSISLAASTNEGGLASSHIFGGRCKRGRMSKDRGRYKTITGGPRHTGAGKPAAASNGDWFSTRRSATVPNTMVFWSFRPTGRPLYLAP